MRLYECESTGKVYEFPDQHCAFCKNCTDLLYDYTNGPYMFMCDLDYTYGEGSTCEAFEDDGYVFDEEDYKRRMNNKIRDVVLIKKLFDENEFIQKQYETFMDRLCSAILGRVERDKED